MGDRFGHRRIVIVGLLSLLIGCILGLNTCSSTVLLISRVIEGFGFTLVVVSIPALIVRTTSQHQRRLALGLWATYMPIGSVLILLLTPPILNFGAWSNVWLFSAFINLSGVLFFFLITHPKRFTSSLSGAVKKSAMDDIKLTLSKPGPWLLALVIGLFTMQNNTMWTWAPSYLIENQSFHMTKAILASIMLPLLNIFGSILGGFLLHRGIPGWMLMSFSSFCMFILTLGMFDPRLSDSLRFSLLVFHALIGPFIPSSANLGIFLGPPVVAAVVSYFGNWCYSSLVLCTCAAIGLFLSVALRGVEERS